MVLHFSKSHWLFLVLITKKFNLIQFKLKTCLNTIFHFKMITVYLFCERPFKNNNLFKCVSASTACTHKSDSDYSWTVIKGRPNLFQGPQMALKPQFGQLQFKTSENQENWISPVSSCNDVRTNGGVVQPLQLSVKSWLTTQTRL